MTDHDVLVLGAGVAGLAAAQQLHQKGLDVAVIEGRDRLGGRVHTLRDTAWPHPIELGAEFLHGRPRALRLEAHARLGPKDADGARWEVDGVDVVRADDRYASAMELIGEMNEREETAARYFRRHRLAGKPVGRMAKELVEGFYAADPRRVSTGFLVSEANGAADVHGDEELNRATRGYDRLPHALARGLSIRRSTRVTRVRWRRGRVEVHGQTVLGEKIVLTAKRAIVALPLGVLRAGDVAFDPMPAAFASALKTLSAGPILKVVLLMRAPFWEKARAKDFTFIHATGSAIPVWWRPKPLDSNVLVGWAAGPRAKRLGGAKPERVLSSAIAGLERAFGVTHLARAIDAFRVVDWAADPFARGGYLVVPEGARAAHVRVAKPFDGAVFFAGEHTDTDGHAGTVHGAVWTGRRAAEEVLAAAARR